ncbi:MAG TPA: RAMP superfamily CRISPR-associated protein [Mycobacteriales bacterium]|nr:RAMP superfamily CRISPR-associated protein [Mycobacteriales bacterium]
MNWAPITFTVDTPMFLSGADGRAEFRLPSLRGAARFWFRALTAPVFGNDFSRVADAEAEVFGAASAEATDNRGHRGPSRIAVRPRELPEPVTEPNPGWLRLRGDEPRKGIAYLLGPGLYTPPRAVTRASHFAPGSTGGFDIRADSDYAGEVFAVCLWALSTFGGLGARTRRGFGGIRFDGLDQLSDHLTRGAALDPTNPAIRRLQTIVAGHHGLQPPDTGGNGDRSRGYPDAPSSSRWVTRTSVRNNTWVQVLNEVGEELRDFRTVDRTAAPYNRQDLPPYRRRATREYLEIIAPHDGTPPPDPSPFPVAAFGLPIVFAHGHVVDLLDENDEPLRRASPLWLRATPDHGGHWNLLCHVFESAIAPAGGKLALKGRDTPHLELDNATAYTTIRHFVDRVAPTPPATAGANHGDQ